MRPRLGSLRSQLFAAIGLILLISAVLTFVVGGLLTRQAVDEATLRDLSHQADLLARREQEDILPLARLPSLKPYLARQGERVAVVSALNAPSEYVSERTLAELQAGRPVNGSLSEGGTTYFFAARPLGDQAFVLLRPHGNASSDWQPFLNALAIAVAAGIVLAGLTSLLLARPITRPLRRVARASRALAKHGVSDPVPVEGPSELRSLASSFNEMAAQLTKAREAERQFLLSVSHELKTPLAAVRGYSEALADGAIGTDEAAETIGREALRLERLVGDLLDLARLNQSAFSIHLAALDLTDVAREAIQRYQTQADAFDLQLELDSSGPAAAVGDHDRLLQVVSNLIENALRVTPPGGVVRVIARAGTLIVEDTGPGLLHDELPHAFERFFLHSRYGKERAVGTGLGLAIVKELIEGMAGSVSVSSDPGHGTRFIVCLPMSQTGIAAPPYAARVGI
jgi:two-component system OmpR family sensor kinase